MALHVRTLFGGAISQFGWLFAAFGMVFVIIFNPGAAILESVTYMGDHPVASGVSTGWEGTGFSVNEQPVYRTTFRFEVDGVQYSGDSYATGSRFEAGTGITIEYDADDPSTARIAGYRSNPTGLGTVFIFVFPLVGLAMAGAGFRRGRRIRSLLINGAVTTGRLVAKEPTSTTVNNQRVMKLTFEFEAESGGVHHATARTHHEYRLEDDARELLVYDPRDPGRAAMLDELPSEPRFNERGEVDESAPGLATPLYLLTPGLCTLAMLRYAIALL